MKRQKTQYTVKEMCLVAHSVSVSVIYDQYISKRKLCDRYLQKWFLIFFVSRPFFNLEPRIFKLAAAEKIQMNVTGLSLKVATIREIWYLLGNVEGINKKELLLECPVVAEFVEPRIELSSTLMNFRYDYGPYSEYYKLTGSHIYKLIVK